MNPRANPEPLLLKISSRKNMVRFTDAQEMVDRIYKSD